MIDNRTKSIPTSSSEVGIYYVYISQGNKDNGVYIVSDFVLPITVTKIAELYIGDNTKSNLNGGNTFTGNQIINGDITVEDITATNFLGNASTATKLKTFVNINGVAFDGSSNITIYDSTKEDIISVGTVFQYFRGDKTWQTLNKIVVGLSNVDNTADANKNVLSATKLTIPRTINNVSFDGSENIVINAVDITPRVPISYMGIANGVATLDNTGIIPITQLPSYVDDVIEVANYVSLPIIGESGKIYVTTNNNKTYRWSGSVYVYITSGAVDSVNGYTGVVVLTKSDFILGNVDNTSDANKPISIATQGALDLKQNLLTLGNFTSTTPGITISNGNGAVIGSGITFNITTAGATTGGLITSGHWNTFNNKWDSSNHPITTLGYGLPDYPTTLPASDVYSWAKQSTKPTYAYSEITSKPTLLSQFTNDLGNYGSFVTGTPWTGYGYLTSITKTQVEAVLTGLITTHTHNYLSSFTETDPIFTAWNKSTGISITKSQVSDFGSYEAPLTFSTGLSRTGNTVTNTITQYTDALARNAQNTANTSTTGLLTSTDWNTFNGKQSALGFTPYNSTNPSGYIAGINSGMVTTALGYTPKPTFTENTGFNKNFGTTTGTVLEGRTFGTAANSAVGDFIQNQNSSAQPGSAWLNGTFTSEGGFRTKGRVANPNNGVILFNDGTGENLILAETASSVYSFGSGPFGTLSTPTLSLNTNTRTATFSSTVNSTGFLLNGNNLTSSLSTNYIPKWNGSSMVNSLISDDGTSVFTNGNKFTRLISGNIRTIYSGGAGLYFTNQANTLDFGYFSESGSLTINSTTPSTAPTNGALVVGGGMGVGGTINATNYIGKSNGFYTVQITQAAYTALGTKNASTIYMIVG